METVFKDEAIVLRKSPVGDFDLSVTVYTKLAGKENIYIPKGQIIKSHLITVFEPFNWFKGVFRYARGKLYIYEVDTFKNLSILIAKDVDRFYTAFEMNKLFNDYVIFPDERFYILLKKSLYYLTKNTDLHLLKLNFLVKLIYLSGIFPELDTCQSCEKKINSSSFGSLSIQKAGILCNDCSKGHMDSPDIVKNLKELKLVSFQNINRLRINKKNIAKIEKFLINYLNIHI